MLLGAILYVIISISTNEGGIHPMAKQKNNGKGETPKPKQVKGRKTLNPIRVRSEEGQTVAIRQKALMAGAASVTTTAVGPNQMETIVLFSKKTKASNDFSNWLQSSRNVELV